MCVCAGFYGTVPDVVCATARIHIEIDKSDSHATENEKQQQQTHTHTISRLAERDTTRRNEKFGKLVCNIISHIRNWVCSQ